MSVHVVIAPSPDDMPEPGKRQRGPTYAETRAMWEAVAEMQEEERKRREEAE